MPHVSIQPASTVTAPQAPSRHSYHPLVRAVLARGADHLWAVKDIAGLLGLSERAVQDMLNNKVVASTRCPTSVTAAGSRYRVTAASLLLYLLSHSSEVPETDLLSALGLIVDQLPDATLLHLITHLQKKVTRRASRAVVVVSSEPPQPLSRTADLFDFPQVSTP